jgi:hypothetical protein
MQMIVVGLDVHKQSVTAVAVDEAGRPLEEKVIGVGGEELLGWAAALDGERLWAVEDCRQLTGWLEQQLLSVGEELVRVPPKLTVPERRAGRTGGKSDPIDAVAIARAALREPDLSRPRPDERIYRSSCWSTIARISWHSEAAASNGCVGICISSTRPTRCRCGASTAPRSWSALRVGLRGASRSCRCGSPATWSRSSANAIERSASSTRRSTTAYGPLRRRCSSCPAARRSRRRSCSPRSARSTASAQARSSPRHSGVAPLEASSGKSQRHRLDRGGNHQLNAPLYRIAITQARYHPPARDYLERKRSEGKSRREALRRLKRLLVRVVSNALKTAPGLT